MARTKQVAEGSFWSKMDAVSIQRRPNGALVAEDVARQIQDLIVSRNLESGARLPSERDLVDLLGTSRQTISQAIRILVVKGLVESRRGSGAYVSRRPQESLAASVNLMLDLDRKSVHDLNRLRLWLEIVGMTEAIDIAPDDAFDDAEVALANLRASIGDTSAWMSADTHFHATIVRCADNAFLSSIYESVHTALIEYEYRHWVNHGKVPKWLLKSNAVAAPDLHGPILEAVRRRDAEAARAAALRHHRAMAEHIAESHLRGDGALPPANDAD